MRHAEGLDLSGPEALPDPSAGRLSLGKLLRYGSFGMPLALVALPIYVYVPKYYSDHFELSIALIGWVLLGVRLLDAISDPLFGNWVDRGRRTTLAFWLHGYRRFIALALPFLAVGYVLLFHPPNSMPKGQAHAAVWLAITLVIVYAGFSLATIAYYSWGADLSPRPSERTRISGVRESCGLFGVLASAALPELIGVDGLSIVFVAALLVTSAVLLLGAPHPPIPAFDTTVKVESAFKAIRLPLGNSQFRVLLVIFLFNGIASAIPATLVLFYIRDGLQLEQYSPLILAIYFIAAAAAIPGWVALSRRIGEARAWLTGMLLAVAVFIWVLSLSSGALVGFSVICLFSGAILGADLSLPPAILAGVIGRGGHRGSNEGAYFGIWNMATKLNLALAAGISLPLLDLLGYQPEHLDQQGVHALTYCYALIPSILKLVAAGLLWRSRFVRDAL